MVAARFVLGQDTLSPELARQVRAAKDLSPAMRSIATYLETEVDFRFEDQKDPAGVPWKPSRRVVEQGGETLSLSGILRRSITSEHDATSATVGTNIVYARIHNEGGTIRGRTRPDRTTAPLRTPFGPRASVSMPRRQFIGFGPDDPDEIKAILVDHFASAA